MAENRKGVTNNEKLKASRNALEQSGVQKSGSGTYSNTPLGRGKVAGAGKLKATK